METTVRIREMMSTPIITESPHSTVEDVAKAMADNHVGSIVISENGNNEGIVTERDICYKVVAKGKLPSNVKAEEIMSINLVTVSPNKTITEAAKIMVKKGIRRLAVVENGKIVGILTASDILTVSPHTVDVLRELIEIYSNPDDSVVKETDVLTEGGTCEVCATFTDNLEKIDGKFLCDDCREELEG